MTIDKFYLCSATENLHGFKGNPDPERVPNQWGYFVCKDHLPVVNQCRRDKGLEELVEFEDSYLKGGDNE
jgi:hypothetical protein